jgi:hypothetical protein
LLIHLVHPISEGCRKSVQKHDHCGHVLVGPSQGRVLSPTHPPPLTADYHVLLCLERGLAVVQFGQLGLNGCSLTDKFTSLLCEPVLGVNL